MKALPIVLTLLALALLMSGTAQAQTASNAMSVNVTVSATCTVTSSGVAFTGPFDGTEVPGTGTITINCSNGAPFNITLDAGSNAIPSKRRMALGPDYLSYELYQDSGRSVVWGDQGFAGTYNAGNPVASIGTGLDQDFTVYAKMPSQQVGPDGNYQDSVSVIVHY
jgi:spore coat protein U-like protein